MGGIGIKVSCVGGGENSSWTRSQCRSLDFNTILPGAFQKLLIVIKSYFPNSWNDFTPRGEIIIAFREMRMKSCKAHSTTAALPAQGTRTCDIQFQSKN